MPNVPGAYAKEGVKGCVCRGFWFLGGRGGLQKSLGKRLAAVYEILNKIEITLIVWTRAHMLLHPWFFGRGFAKGRGLCVLCLAKAKTISEFDEQILVTRVTTTLEKGGGVIEGVWGATEPPCWCS